MPKPEEKYEITIKDEDLQFTCRPSQSVIQALVRVSPDHPMHGCQNGGCGVCKVRVLKGEYKTGLMSAEHISEEERAVGYALACRIYPQSDMLIAFIGKIK